MATNQIPKIDVQKRGKIGSRYAARLRQTGQLPAVIYGHKQDVLHVAMNYRQATDLLHTNAHILDVQIDGQSQPVLVKDVQWDHLGSKIVHLDLERIDLNERVTVKVDLTLTGEPVGLKEEGAILEHPVSQLEIECLAVQIPDKIKVDISHLKVGGVVTIKDVQLPEGVKCLMDAHMTVATITVIKEEVVEVAPVEGAAAEPEVIGRKPAEGEEGEEAAAKPAAGGEKKPAEKTEKK